MGEQQPFKSPVQAAAVASQPASPGKSTGTVGMMITVIIIFLWYLSNIGLLLLNKLLLSNFGFRFPVYLTLLHMIACTFMSYAAVGFGVFKLQYIQSRQQFFKIATVALVFCGSLVLANTSLKYIPVSFNQAIGSTTPAFTAAFAVLMTRKYETRQVYLTLVPVVLGICIASGFEPSFHMLGFACCLLATAARAFKSVLQGLLLFDNSEKMDSMNLLLYMSPIASVALIPITLYYEPKAMDISLTQAAASRGFLGLLLLNVFLAYFVNLANFLVTRHTSALTLQVLGNAKGVIAAGVSVAIFKNKLTPMGVLGYAITVAGVCAYSETKRRQKLAAALRCTRVEDVAEKLPLILEAGELKAYKGNVNLLTPPKLSRDHMP